MPRFSIITPSFNQAAFVDKCIESVAVQTFQDYEHIVLDAVSTDGTAEKLAKYAKRNPRATVKSGKDRGQVDAINKGFHQARGDYLIWLNTDDYFIDARVLGDVAAVLDKTQPDFLYGGGEFVDPQGEPIKDVYINDDSDRLIQRFMVSVGILQPATFIRREAFLELGDLLEHHPFCFDYEFWMRGAFAGRTFKHLDRKLTRATLHNDSKTVGDRAKSLVDTCTVNKAYYGFTSAQWARKLADCRKDGADGIVQAGGPASDEAGTRKEFAAMNKDKRAKAAALSWAHVPEARESVRLLRETWDVDTSQTVVTAFDDQFFAAGLTLISGLHRNERKRAIFVYDIGLSVENRDLLNGLKDVFVLDFDASARQFCEDYFSTQTYGFKSYVMWHCRHYLAEGDLLLWMDAGVYPLNDLSRTYEQIASADVFLVDHDDKGIWPVYNITFTSDEAVKALKATPDELMAPHLRAGVAGFKRAGRFDAMFEKAFEYSCDPNALTGDKHPKPPVYKTRSGGTAEERARMVEDPEWRAAQPMSKIRDMFGYFGHRHDQAILSILAAREGAPYCSASQFCIADDASSNSSRERWMEGADVSASDEISAFYRNSNAEMMQHRGLFRNTDHLIFEGVMRRGAAMVLGNGPSLRGFDFDQLEPFDVFGMNAAYRFWHETGDYPEFYCCLDLVVGLSHKDAIGELITNAEEYGIQKFLLRRNLIDALGEVGRSECVMNFDALKPHLSLLQAPTITTGSHTAAWAGVLGYENIFMLGIDCNYVELVPGARATGQGTELEIVEEKDNPNYFFDGYQQKGDRYNVPNPDRDIHMSAWREVAERLIGQGKSLLNANLQSKVDSVDFCRFESIQNGVATQIIPRNEILSASRPSGQNAPPATTAAPRETASAGKSEPEHKGLKMQTSTVAAAPGRNASRLKALGAVLKRQISRYGAALVPLVLVITALAAASVQLTGEGQLAAVIALVAVFALAGVLLAAEAARRMSLHLRTLQAQIDAAQQQLARRDEVSELKRELASARREAVDQVALRNAMEAVNRNVEAKMRDDGHRIDLQLGELKAQVKDRAPKASIENLRAMIKDLNATLEEVQSSQARDERDFATQVDALEGAFEQLNRQVSGLGERAAGHVGRSELDERLRQLDGEFGKLADQIADRAPKAALGHVTALADSLGGKVEALEASLGDLSERVADNVDRAEMEQQSQRLEGDLAKLADTIRGKVEALEASLGDLSERVADNVDRAEMEQQRQRLEGDLTKLADQIADRAPKAALANVNELARQLDEAVKSLEAAQARNERDVAGQIDSLESEVSTMAARIAATPTLEFLDDALKLKADDEALSALSESLRELRDRNMTVNDITDELSERIAGMRDELAKVSQQANQARESQTGLETRVASLASNNLRGYNLFNRALNKSHVEEFRSNWTKALGVKLDDRTLYYMADRVVNVEANLQGRLATDIETAIIRSIALESIRRDEVSILEIGTLFGVGAALLYEHASHLFSKVDLDLLDPLDGYYGAGARDILSGVSVNEQTLKANLKAANIPDDNVRLIKHFSHDEEALKAVEGRQYDYLLIDGDHTRSGIQIDFEHYGPLVRRGGLVVFDDYGTEDWPDVAEYVDDVVAKDPRFSFVASGWRTAIYRRVD